MKKRIKTPLFTSDYSQVLLCLMCRNMQDLTDRCNAGSIAGDVGLDEGVARNAVAWLLDQELIVTAEGYGYHFPVASKGTPTYKRLGFEANFYTLQTVLTNYLATQAKPGLWKTPEARELVLLVSGVQSAFLLRATPGQDRPRPTVSRP